jgi:hypothetical protein
MRGPIAASLTEDLGSYLGSVEFAALPVRNAAIGRNSGTVGGG